MRFKTFLEAAAEGSEPLKYTELEAIDAIKLMRTHCKDAEWMFKKDYPLWRGEKHKVAEFGILDPSSTTRKSQNTSNYYTAILDHFADEWGFPLRSKSIICTFDKDRAESYTRSSDAMYALIPFDGVKFGCVNKEDIFDVHVSMFGKKTGLAMWNEFFQRMGIHDSWNGFEDLVKDLSDESPSSNEKRERLLKKISAVLGKKWTSTIENDPGFILDELENSYAPDVTKFTVHTTATVNKNNWGECWVGGKCLAIRQGVWETMQMRKGDTDLEDLF